MPTTNLLNFKAYLSMDSLIELVELCQILHSKGMANIIVPNVFPAMMFVLTNWATVALKNLSE